MDLNLLRVLVELDRHGTMRAVAASTRYSTSTVSVQLAALEKEMGAKLLERVGRKVRLTPAGRRLVEHAEKILNAVESARADVAPDGEPSGRLRVAGAASALAMDLVPIAGKLQAAHPQLRLELEEREPAEVEALLDADRIDLGFVYDYSLVPRYRDNGCSMRFTCDAPLALAVPASDPLRELTSREELRRYADTPWIANSRGDDDTTLAERLCGQAGFRPRVAHRVDSLGLVLDFVAAGLGVGLVPAYVPVRDGARLLPVVLDGVPVKRRMFAVTRPGRQAWAAVRAVVDMVTERG